MKAKWQSHLLASLPAIVLGFMVARSPYYSWPWWFAFVGLVGFALMEAWYATELTWLTKSIISNGEEMLRQAAVNNDEAGELLRKVAQTNTETQALLAEIRLRKR